MSKRLDHIVGITFGLYAGTRRLGVLRFLLGMRLEKG
jgi:hypothetical protein